jgi:hypothetical protein
MPVALMRYSARWRYYTMLTRGECGILAQIDGEDLDDATLGDLRD